MIVNSDSGVTLTANLYHYDYRVVNYDCRALKDWPLGTSSNHWKQSNKDLQMSAKLLDKTSFLLATASCENIFGLSLGKVQSYCTSVGTDTLARVVL